MEKPSKKLKKTLLIVGITGAVYAGFQYLLPLVIPFFVAYVLALGLRPSALWLEKRIFVRFRGKKRHIPLGIIGGVQIFVLLALAGAGLYSGGRRLCAEARLLVQNLPEAVKNLDIWLTGNCTFWEKALHLKKGAVVHLVREMLLDMGQAMKETAMPFLMVNSMTIFKCVIQISVLTVILFIATILCMQEMDDIRCRRDNSQFRQEFSMLGNRLASVGTAYVKTQGAIMLLTMAVCTAGLFVMGNPYSILLGIGIGLLDALPIFGTGTVLIPWAAISAVRGSFLEAAGLAAIYIVCYFLREILEAKIMGNQVGLTPLETLVSMYVGLQLFGLLGFILGPVGLIIIEDLVELYAE